jgi:hypothetical protein
MANNNPRATASWVVKARGCQKQRAFFDIEGAEYDDWPVLQSYLERTLVAKPVAHISGPYNDHYTLQIRECEFVFVVDCFYWICFSARVQDEPIANYFAADLQNAFNRGLK